jgi:hypothetical protein
MKIVFIFTLLVFFVSCAQDGPSFCEVSFDTDTGAYAYNEILGVTGSAPLPAQQFKLPVKIELDSIEVLVSTTITVDIDLFLYTGGGTPGAGTLVFQETVTSGIVDRKWLKFSPATATSLLANQDYWFNLNGAPATMDFYTYTYFNDSQPGHHWSGPTWSPHPGEQMVYRINGVISGCTPK